MGALPRRMIGIWVACLVAWTALYFAFGTLPPPWVLVLLLVQTHLVGLHWVKEWSASQFKKLGQTASESNQAEEYGGSTTTLAHIPTPVYCPTEGTLTVWYVQIGQQVAVHDKLGTLMDNKGTEVPMISPYSGRVAKILEAPGAEVRQWTPLLMLADARNKKGRDMSNAFHNCLIRWLADRAWPYTPTTLAIALNVPGDIPWRWLTGGEHPTDEQLVALAVHLGVSEEELEEAREAIATIPPVTLPGYAGESSL